MKFFKTIGLLTLLMLITTGCVSKDPDYGNFGGKDVDFS